MRTLCVLCVLVCGLSTMGMCADFDTASVWVTGVRWACGANKDRKSPPPVVKVRFRNDAGRVLEYAVGQVLHKDRHLMFRRFSADEQKALKGYRLDAFFFSGLTDEDNGAALCDGRVYRESFAPIETPVRARRNLVPMPGQDIGNNTGVGRLPFPVREKTVQPIAASAKPPCAILPCFSGRAISGADVAKLQITERREGRCLIVDMYAPPGAVTEIALGAACETNCLERIFVPYLTMGLVDRLAGGFFRYALFDWYRSNASMLAMRDVNGVKMPVASYLPKTDGTYNPVCERIVITLSDAFTDVLPEIPNPPSPYKKMTGTRVWRTHAAFDRARDAAFWQTLHDAGIRQVCVTDHETMWRDGGESFTFVTEAAKGKGGDRAQKDFTRFMIDKLGYVYGPYNNYMDYSPNNSRFWDVDKVARRSDGSLVPAWMRSYSPKATAILPMCEEIVAEAQAKFGFRGAYCDVHSAIPPWERTDYDARCPGAGTFTQVFYAYGELFLLQKRLWNGPVWSEGANRYMYAGLVDGNYAQDWRKPGSEMPWIVDFDLLKIHPLECDFGMGSLSMFSPGKTDIERQYYLPNCPDGVDALVDLYLCATVAFGHAGYLIADWMFDPPKMFGLAYGGPGRETFERGLALARKSYFKVQPLAARYTQETAQTIRYFNARGEALGISDALRTGIIDRRQIYVGYTGGVHVLANAHPRDPLTATIGGKTFTVRPRGFRGWTDDGAVSVEN